MYSRQLCQSYGLEIVSLETKAEFDHFLGLCSKENTQFDEYTHIGAMTLVGKTGWHWVNSGKRIDYQLKWLSGQPDFYASADFCMSVVKRGTEFSLADIYCYGAYDTKFVCQRNEI
jgi:hypothetical protein